MAHDLTSEIGELSKNVEAAYDRIKPHILRTPLMFSQPLSAQTKANIFLKLESEQVTGSFKIRGALNKILLLKEQDPEKMLKGLVAASSGNYGIACMQAAKIYGCSVEIFTREGMSESKMSTLLSNGAKVTSYGKDRLDAEMKARQTAKERGQTYLSPYNDLDGMAGHGTIAYEIYDQLPDIDYVLVAVGGGGGIGGIAAFFKNKNPKVQVIGCQSKNSKVMYASVKAGYIVHEDSLDTLSDGTSGDIEDGTVIGCQSKNSKVMYASVKAGYIVHEDPLDTLSDGTSGDIEDGTVTFPICKTCVDDWILVDEKQISDAVFFMLEKHHKLIEGSAGVVIASLLDQEDRFQGKNVVLLICGSNISSDTLKKILDDHINTN